MTFKSTVTEHSLASGPVTQDPVFFGSFSSTAAVMGATPVIGNLQGDSLAWPGVGNTVVLDSGANAVVNDAEFGALNGGNGDWAGGTLAVQRSGTAVSSDMLDFDTSGALFSVSGGNLQSGGLTFASYTHTGGVLTISFTSTGTAATTALVQDVLQRVTYRNDTPGGDATVKFSLSDGTSQATAVVTVNSNTIYVTNTTDTAVNDASDGVSLSEALVLAAGGGKTIVFAASLAGSTIHLAANATVPANTSFLLEGSGTVTIDSNKLTFSDQFNVSVGNGAQLVVNSTISGTADLQKSGAGSLVLGGSNEYTGTTTVSAGTLGVAGDSNLGSAAIAVDSGAKLAISGAGTIDNAFTLTGNATIEATANTTLSGAVGGGGNLVKAGNGTLTLSGANTYAGTTTVGGGSLSVASDSNLGSGNVDLATGTKLAITGATLIDNAIALTGNATIEATANVTLSGELGGAGSLTKAGSGKLTLSGTNTHTGAVAVDAGTLALSGGSSLGNNSAVTVGTGATLALEGGGETIGSLAGTGNVSLGYKLTLGGDNTSTAFSGNISSTNTSGIQKDGSGTFTLSGTNTYTGSTTVNGGTLALSGGSAIGDASAVTVNSGATLDLSAASETLASLAGAGNAALGNKTLTVGGNNTSTTFSGQLSGSGTLAKTGTGTLELSGTNNSATFSGSTAVSGGALSVGSDGNLGTNALSLGASTRLILTGGNIDNTVALSGNATISATAAATLSGAINGAGHNLLKTGLGALTLSNSATLNDVTVGEGALVVGSSGTLTGSSVNVSSGATLAGTGTVNGPLTIASGATLAPGNTAAGAGVGKLRVLGDLAINTGGKLAVDINGATAIAQYDLLEAEGAVNITGATLDVTLGYTPAAGDFYALLDTYDNGTTITGTFNALAEAGTITANATVLKASYAGGTDLNDFTLTVPLPVAAPDPGPTTPPPAPTVDGVAVTTTAGSNGATLLTIAVVPATRTDTAGTPNPTLADIPLAKDASGQTLLQAGLPTGMGLAAEGLPTAPTGAAAQTELIQRIERLAGTGSELGPQAQAFLATLGASEPLTVQTLKPTVGAGFNPAAPLVITGGSGQQAIVIDASALPSGTVIQVDNVEFVAIVGAVRIIGGAGQNMASGDGSAQWIVLGPDDDIIHGGGGNDVVGSEAGDDQVFGDAGDDIVFGGAGNDLLSGGTGSDRLNGGTGFDVAIQEGQKTDYTVTLDGAGIKLTHTATGVSDWLVDVEQVRFATGPSLTVAHSAAEEAGAYLFQKWIGRDLNQGEGAIIQSLTGKTALEVATLFAQFFPEQSAGKTPAQLLEGMGSAGAIRVDAVRDITVTGDAGNNTITPTLGLARYVDGGAGIDTVVIPATLGQTYVQSQNNGTFTLQRLTDGAMLDVTRVERVTFNDTKLALDLNGHAGEAAKLLGALGGPALLTNKGVVGEVIRLLDAGATGQTIAGLGLQLLGVSTPTQIAQTLWTNVVGRAGTQAELKPLLDLMAGGVSGSELAVMAANLELNAVRIDLVGLTAKGIEFA